MQLVSAEAAAALDVTSAAFKSAQKELMLKAILRSMLLSIQTARVQIAFVRIGQALKCAPRVSAHSTARALTALSSHACAVELEQGT